MVNSRRPTGRKHVNSLMIFAPISSASLHVKLGVRPPEMTLTRTGFGARAATVLLRRSAVRTPSMKQTSAPASAASLRRVIASSMPSTCALSVRPMMTKSEPPGIASRAMTAARMRVMNSSRETTCLPRR